MIAVSVLMVLTIINGIIHAIRVHIVVKLVLDLLPINASAAISVIFGY